MNRSLRRDRTPKIPTTQNTDKNVNRDRFIAALFAGAVIVNVLVTAPPAGVTVAGLNAHVAPTGNPEHAKLTAALNPFAGVTVSIVVAVPPALTESDVDDAANVKVGDGRLMV